MWVFASIGGAFGALCRYSVGVRLVKYKSFFWGTLLVNILGSFLLGVFMGFQMQAGQGTFDSALWVLLAEGFLGAFTTFSTFSYESFLLFQSGKKMKAMTNILLNVLVCILLAYIGFIGFEVLS